jgi:hypothetical protein
MPKKTKAKTKKAPKTKRFVYTITALQEFEIMWDIEAVSKEAAEKQIKRKFKDIRINRQWSSGSLEDDKQLSPYWTPTQNATISINILEEE